MVDLNKLKESAEVATPYCGDNSCKFAGEKWAPRGGMATNGGCRCFRDIRDMNFRRLVSATGPSTILKLIEVIKVQGEALKFYASHQGRQHDCPTCDLGDQAEDAINEVKKILGEK